MSRQKAKSQEEVQQNVRTKSPNAAVGTVASSDLEIQKLKIEQEKLQLERDKLIIAVLLEDFKARWQELLNLASENNRWQTLYVTALMLVIGWIINISKDYESIEAIFDKGNNSIFILVLAGINAIYTLAIAYRGYNIQEIGLYLYTNTAKKINERIGNKNTATEILSEVEDIFNSWERWRRSTDGTPKWIRFLFYPVVSILPLLVSFTILYLYWFYKFDEVKLTCFDVKCYDIPNHFFIFTLFFVILCLISSALSSVLMTYEWTKVMDKNK